MYPYLGYWDCEDCEETTSTSREMKTRWTRRVASHFKFPLIPSMWSPQIWGDLTNRYKCRFLQMYYYNLERQAHGFRRRVTYPISFSS